MRMPRFRVRTLMLAVAAIAILSASWAGFAARLEQKKWATVRIINRRSTPLNRLTLIYPDGERDLASIPANDEANATIRIEGTANIYIRIDGTQSGGWEGVRGGSVMTMT